MTEQAEVTAADTATSNQNNNPESENNSSSQYENESIESLLDIGRRFLANKKYSEACEALSFAVEKSSETYGEMAEECVDALMLYGNALLNNGISTQGVLGENVPSGGNQETSGAVAESSSKSVNASSVPPPPPPASSSSSSSTPVPLVKPDGSKAKIFFEGDDDDDEEEEEEGGDDEETGDNEEEQEKDDQDDLELAFAILDTARTILNKSQKPDTKNKLIRVHKMLGDVATEDEQFELAATDYKASLALQKELYEAHDRRIAETHLFVALALEFVPDKPDARTEAIHHAEMAKKVLILKKEQLQNVIDKNESEEKEKEDAQAELKDIDGVMDDLQMKIDDLKTEPTKNEQDKDSPFSSSKVDPNAAVNDLTNLVKKKSKSKESTPQQDNTAPTTTPTTTTAAPAPIDLSASVNGKRTSEQISTTDDDQNQQEKKQKTTTEDQ